MLEGNLEEFGRALVSKCMVVIGPEEKIQPNYKKHDSKQELVLKGSKRDQAVQVVTFLSGKIDRVADRLETLEKQSVAVEEVIVSLKKLTGELHTLNNRLASAEASEMTKRLAAIASVINGLQKPGDESDVA